VVEKMSKVMSVSVSGYYYWLKEPVGAPTVKKQELVVDIHGIYDESEKRGSESGLGLIS
jgi:hypothetical protein